MKNKRKLVLFLMFFLLPITLNYFSPYLIIEGLTHGILAGAFFIWLLMFISSLFAGRAFCSYICPYGGLQMTVDAAIKKPLKQIPWLKKVRMVLAVLWVVPIILLTLLRISSLKPDFFYLTESFVSIDHIIKLAGYYVIVTALMLLPLILGKRATCHYLCPMSILNTTGTWIRNKLNLPSLRLSAVSSRCTSCRQCSKACPMSLPVSEMARQNKTDSLECILCGECCQACPNGVLKRSFGQRSYSSNVEINKQA